MGPIVCRFALHAATVAFVLGCSDPTGLAEPPVPARDASPLQTERLEYPFAYTGGTYHGRVVVTYTNAGLATVFLSRPGLNSVPTFFLQWAGPKSAPADVEGPISVGVGTPPIEMLPGASRTDTLDFLLHERDANGRYTTAPRNAGRSGLYRLFYQAYARVVGTGDWAYEAGPLPKEAGLSNVFRIRFTR